jgi:hypothetical protein
VSNGAERGGGRSAADWLEAVVAEERRGELLTAFDLAERALVEHPHDRALQHRAVLALARAGSTDLAAERFEQYSLGSDASEDVRALEARIAKDRALAAEGEERRRLARNSSALYQAIFADTHGYYPGVNAATLRLLAGDAAGAEELAARVLEILRDGDDEGYYAVATEAEAHLLLGDVDSAAAAVERAAGLHGGDHAATATTRRQLRLVCAERAVDPAVLAPLAGPRVVHYCGHRLAPAGRDGPFPAEAVARVAGAIGTQVEQLRPSFGYGALANGADILWAEALLDRGAELHVVLPFARDEFVRASVADAGPAWVERFERCLAAATGVSYATDDAFLSDDVLYRYGSELAMGLTLLRSRFLESEAHQLAVWDGLPARGAAGTAIDVATWGRGGRAASIVRPDGEPAQAGAPAEAPSTDGGPAEGRVVRALLFADVHGFSKLRDEQYPRFADLVLGTFAEVLRRHDDAVCFRNTWGDGLYVVLTDPVAAAACALELQEAMTAVHPTEHRLPAHLALRLGGHLGPVFPTRDPVLGVDAFMGSHVSRTARIEPVTPAGAVYVTEAFAAALELAAGRFACDYVGHMPAAKDYGRLRMYRLRTRAG